MIVLIYAKNSGDPLKSIIFKNKEERDKWLSKNGVLPICMTFGVIDIDMSLISDWIRTTKS